jgi:hypothetical protein
VERYDPSTEAVTLLETGSGFEVLILSPEGWAGSDENRLRILRHVFADGWRGWRYKGERLSTSAISFPPSRR